MIPGAVLIAAAALACVRAPGRVRRRLRAVHGVPSASRRWRGPTIRPGRWTALTVAAAAAAVGGVLGGLVAAVLTGAYAALAARALVRRSAARTTLRRRDAAVDALAGLAADLRAGAAPAPAFAAAIARLGGTGADAVAEARALTADPAVGPVARRLAAAYELAERVGAPLADVCERADGDLRAEYRAAAHAAAQAAGTRATAVLLAALPLAGLALGYGLGADPLDVLLHTPLGAGCALGALALQVGGLAWTDRLARTGVVA